MSESSLSVGYPEIRSEIGFLCGWGRTSGNWSATQITRIQAVLDRGLRQFYFHAPLPQAPNHEWTFLRPVATMQTAASYATGTVAVTNASTTVTLTTGTWPTWAASGVFVHNGVSYSVATRSSGSVILLDNAFAGTTATAQTYFICEQDYDLPDNFGAMESPLTYAMNEAQWPLQEVSEAQIRIKRQSGANNGRPQYFAVRPKTTDGTVGQRFEIMFWPTPDAVYNFSYRYMILASTLSSGFPYPYGGAALAECVMASCLAAAEAMELDIPQGPNYAKFMGLLAAGVNHDLRMGPKFLGYNGDGSGKRGRYQPTNYIMYNNVIYGS